MTLSLQDLPQSPVLSGFEDIAAAKANLSGSMLEFSVRNDIAQRTSALFLPIPGCFGSARRGDHAEPT